MENIQSRTGAFTPAIAIQALREDGDHLLADMIEGMADRIAELEGNLNKPRTTKRRTKRR